jgi:alpha-galactosidase
VATVDAADRGGSGVVRPTAESDARAPPSRDYNPHGDDGGVPTIEPTTGRETTMHLGRVSLATLLLATVGCGPAATKQDLTGKWVFEKTLGEGGPPGGGRFFASSVLELHQDGPTLTGSMQTHIFEMPLSNGKVEGDTLSFTLVADRAGHKMEVPTTGKVVPEGIELTSHPPEGMPPMSFLMRRASDAEVVERIGETPARIEPPAIHPLPDNGLARTPPMGWNSWNHFHTEISDATVREVADALVSSGMRDAGYVYVNIDDGWQGKRDANGELQPNEHFPDMKALADYVHGKGLKLGIYSSPGPRTCANYEGSYGHEEQDARTWARWGIDYLKYDWCGAFRIYKPEDMHAVYQKMGGILREAGRPIVYSLCQYGMADVWTWGKDAGGNLWRTTGDIRDGWESMEKIGFDQGRLAEFAGPGHWNDPDMLEVGNGGMTATEYRTHMTLWSLLAAPLLAGNDVRDMSPETLALLTSPEVIAVDQDPLGHAARRVAEDGTLEVWSRPLSGGRVAAGLFNRGETPASVTVRWADVGLDGKVAVRDAWARKDLGESADHFAAEVEPHGAALLILGKR